VENSGKNRDKKTSANACAMFLKSFDISDGTSVI
jgi:hypothetical protein